MVISMMRQRSRVMFSAVAFKTVRRNSRVPNVELFSGSLVRSRTRLGELEEPTHGSSRETGNDALSWKLKLLTNFEQRIFVPI